MDGRYVEPRKVMWAVAEVSWLDGTGMSFRAPATLEDTSPSGACLRVGQPFAVGSRVTIKWYREQFEAVAKNCRSDGRDFLLGVQRKGENVLENPLAAASAFRPSKPVASLRKNALSEKEPKSLPQSIPLGISPTLAVSEFQRNVANASNDRRLLVSEYSAPRVYRRDLRAASSLEKKRYVLSFRKESYATENPLSALLAPSAGRRRGRETDSYGGSDEQTYDAIQHTQQPARRHAFLRRYLPRRWNS